MNLIEHLTVVEETRSDINKKHDLVDVIFLVISAIMAGAEGWQDIQLHGESKEDWLRQYRPFKNGIPKRHTIARILKSVVAESLLEALLNWVNEQRQTAGKPVIALDGKVLRGSYRGDKKAALQLVTAYDTESGLVLSQQSTETKQGEISVVRQMLEVLDIKGSVITVDTLHCQRQTLETIAAKKADVVVQVTKNQPKLHQAVTEQFQRVFDAGKEQVVTEVKQQAHGRTETRIVYQLKPKLDETLAARWPTIRSIIAVERHRACGGKTSIDTSYYVSSMSPKHKMLGHYIRQHWRIENGQHYVLDVVFKEDASRICLDGAVENMALFRRFVMNMLKQCECGLPSQRSKLKTAGWNDKFRAQVFFGL
ncbi:ISAs1 family transposase [Pseudoalteromonas sp. GCY]|uniref:ISAs1 family transposase n=1 Tax=Pseudoalteromonas sp. GCY TaxID=2003316 RepID=UPI000BFED997|nr:ISAs1 family transposase [Pseudoalteromonas sp. GCY]PHI36190.1 ISAs1 family transposase [Pseudoalteromonas sp. GCY]QQQ65453.1 ISAs1 family transposase [Pseudoalteromonas sp. GCY]